MKYILVVCAFIALVIADISLAINVNFPSWHPPAGDDVRSPCPALNSLANHGILPRDGRNLTVPMLVKAIGSGLKVSPEVSITLSTLGLSLSKDPSTDAFDLDDLNKHNAIEHDASLSRRDFDLGGNAQVFDEDVFNETLSYFKGATDIGIEEVAAARWGRVQSSKKNNPKSLYGDKQIFPSHFESSAYYQLFKNPKTEKASVKWIKIFFREERLPFREGWRPVNHIDGFSVAQAVLQISMLTPEASNDGCGRS